MDVKWHMLGFSGHGCPAKPKLVMGGGCNCKESGCEAVDDLEDANAVLEFLKIEDG